MLDTAALAGHLVPTGSVYAFLAEQRWKVACGLPIDHEGFHPTTLTVWRNRLRVSDHPERIFEAVRAVIAARGAQGQDPPGAGFGGPR